MKTSTTAILPADVEATRRRFAQWRQTRKSPTPIPESLWAEAVNLADSYGVSRTARALGVAYYSLKDRVERQRTASAAAPPTRSAAAFLELAVPARAGLGECLLEWEHATGAKMRVHLQGLETPDLIALSRSFWEGQR
jgi:hypothetical protein